MGEGMVWAVLKTKRGKEYFARDQLRNQGAEVYIPECRQDVKKRGLNQYERKTIPLFSGILFVNLNDLPVRTALSTRGISGSVKRSTGEIQWMTARDIEAVLSLCAVVADMTKEAAHFYIGQQMTIRNSVYGEISVEVRKIIGSKLELTLANSNGSVKITTTRDKLANSIAA